MHLTFQMCETLVNHDQANMALSMFARSQDPILQKVVTKIIFCMFDTREMK